MTAPADFTELLNMDAGEAIRPPAMPTGTYRFFVKENESATAKTGTQGLKFTLADPEPQADVDVDKWSEYVNHPAIDKDQIQLQETFWLTRKSMWRMKDFCVACGTAEQGPMHKLVADAMHNRVLVSVVQTPSKDGKAVFNEVNGYAKDE